MNGLNTAQMMSNSSDMSNPALGLFNVQIGTFFSIADLLVRFALNILVIAVIVRVLYYNTTRRKDYLFTFILISTIVFLLCYMLATVNLGIGFALGLFAIFGIIRYRTISIPIREMTYLFVVIGVTVMNALSGNRVSIIELLFCDLIVLGIIWAMERVWLIKHESSKLIIYEKIELIKTENYEALLADLKERTGLDIHRAEVGNINFLRDTAEVIIYYYNGVSNVSPDQCDQISNLE
ncbi:MAG: DUF4956 domain-containing protein [Bacteroidota bacterium]|nr:DUF4956 domain-containing protein [Bacteroidota bacterium]MDP4205057.1 DUF4956 domain-containing protein [Bacteroidota bacterium]